MQEDRRRRKVERIEKFLRSVRAWRHAAKIRDHVSTEVTIPEIKKERLEKQIAWALAPAGGASPIGSRSADPIGIDRDDNSSVSPSTDCP